MKNWVERHLGMLDISLSIEFTQLLGLASDYSEAIVRLVQHPAKNETKNTLCTIRMF